MTLATIKITLYKILHMEDDICNICGIPYTIKHIFHCYITKQIWHMFFSSKFHNCNNNINWIDSLIRKFNHVTKIMNHFWFILSIIVFGIFGNLEMRKIIKVEVEHFVL